MRAIITSLCVSDSLYVSCCSAQFPFPHRGVILSTPSASCDVLFLRSLTHAVADTRAVLIVCGLLWLSRRRWAHGGGEAGGHGGSFGGCCVKCRVWILADLQKLRTALVSRMNCFSATDTCGSAQHHMLVTVNGQRWDDAAST